MKKILFFAAAAVAMLTGCSQSDDLTAPTVAQNAQTPIEFGTYLGKTAQTRATIGKTGDINDAALQAVEASGGGFGVFAYYTKNTAYTYDQSSYKPNFMYNQGVFYSNPKWAYSPVKYWPNGLDDQAGADGGDDGTLTEGGKVSFFAYAPYVTYATASGATAEDYGIVGMSANTVQGNPTLTYRMPTTGIVDLLWGTANSSGNSLAGTTQNGTTLADHTATDGASPTPHHYYVNADLTKQQIDGKVKFLFKHALAKVGGSGNDGVAGGLQIMLDIDNLNGGAAEDDNTKVTVKSIKISTDLNDDSDFDDTDEKIVNKGTLDLATGLWTLSDNASDQAGFTQTIDRVGTAPASKLNPDIAEPASWNATWAENTLPGVKIAPKNVYDTGQENSPLLFFPGQTPKLRFTINYIVRTKDTNIDGGYSFVEQTVAKTVTFGSPVIMNKKYNIIIHLGLTSVKFEATVDTWSADIDDDGNVDDNDKTKVNLPLNVE